MNEPFKNKEQTVSKQEKKVSRRKRALYMFLLSTALTHNTIQRLIISLNLNLKEQNAEKKSYSFTVRVY